MRNTARSNTAKNKDLHTYLSEEVVNNGFGETKCDQLIVIDDVSGLADESKNFARFLTFACNFNCSCVYIFHMIYPEKTIWKKFFSLMSILNIFPASVLLASVRKILESLCIKKQERIFHCLHFGLVDFLLN